VMIAIVAAVGVMVAQERATFLLSDGERVSGLVVFHTEARTNIRADKNEFNVKVSSGEEMPIAFGQVVAIDFAGGTPTEAELAALQGNGQVLSLRNGENRQGRLVDLVGGDTVRWRNTNGDETNIPISDTRRIYLRPDRVREVYNLPPASATATASAAASATSSIPAGSIPVPATVRWTDSGVTVRRNQDVMFRVSGQVKISDTVSSGPGGVATGRQELPLPAAQVGALIGRVGNGAPFVIGDNDRPIRMNTAGRLMLAVNDDQLMDNSGEFRVVIVQ